LFAGHQTQVTHQLGRARETTQVAQFGHEDGRVTQKPQVFGRPRRRARVANVVAQQKHLQLLPGPMLRPHDLKARAQQITHGLVFRLREVNARQFARAKEPRQLIGIAPVRLHPIARLARHPRGTDDEALITQPAQAPAQRIPARPGLVTELQGRAGLGGLELPGAPQHVLMRAAEDPVAPHLGGITGRDGKGDGVIVDIQAEEEDNVHVSAFLSWLSLLDQQGGSAHRPTPGRNPRSRKADPLRSPIASHSG